MRDQSAHYFDFRSSTDHGASHPNVQYSNDWRLPIHYKPDGKSFCSSTSRPEIIRSAHRIRGLSPNHVDRPRSTVLDLIAIGSQHT